MKHVTQLKADTLTTAQMEERIRQVSTDIRRYRDIENSSELAEFMALKPIVEAKEFQDYKQELLTTKYKEITRAPSIAGMFVGSTSSAAAPKCKSTCTLPKRAILRS